MPFPAVNGIDVYFEPHGTGPPLPDISRSGNALRRSSASQYDDIAPVASSDPIAERMPNAASRVVDGGHTFPIRDRSAFPAIIELLEFDGGAS